jgi:two-component system nitrate/nitrite response regulator NarL
MIRIFLVDDHALFLAGLAYLLAAQPDIEVAGCAGSLAEARLKLPDARPDLLLLDVDLGDDRAIDFLRHMSPEVYAGRVLLVTAGVSEFEAIQLVHAGAHGVFHKNNPPEELCSAIRRVAGGDVVLEPEYLKGLFAAIDPKTVDPRPRLSDREVLLLRHLLQGLANKEIATEMQMSESSVKAILRALFDKLGVRSRSQLVKVALDEYREFL